MSDTPDNGGARHREVCVLHQLMQETMRNHDHRLTIGLTETTNVACDLRETRDRLQGSINLMGEHFAHFATAWSKVEIIADRLEKIEARLETLAEHLAAVPRPSRKHKGAGR